MKKVLTVFTIAAALFTAMSCQKEGQNDTTSAKHELSLTAQVAGRELPVINTYDLKGGQERTVDIVTSLKEQGNYDIKITYGADESLVEAFNTVNSTSYTVLPSTAYSFNPEQVQFAKYNKYAPFSVLTITAPELEESASFLLPVTITKVETADEYTVNPESAAVYFIINVEATDPNGSGTEQAPYLLKTAEDLMAIESKLVEGTEVFFTMENDIDMTGVDNWVPINLDSPHGLKINFNGKGHKISNFTCEGKTNPGFFGVLNGTIQNVTFDNARVAPTGKGSGVIAAYAGKGEGVKAHIKNVKVLNSVNVSKQQMSAIVAGLSSDCTIEQVYIENCSIKSEEGKPRYVAFFVGIDDKATAPTLIKNCYVKGGEIVGNQQVAGIFGRSINGVTIENCGVSARLEANDAAAAGILGQGSSGDKQDKITGCVVWCPEILVTSTPDASLVKYSSATIVGAATGKNYVLNNCVYNPALSFTDGRYPDTKLPQTSADVNGTEVAGHNSNYGPWFGKPATATTASAAAKALGWDESIWDLSGDEPKLK